VDGLKLVAGLLVLVAVGCAATEVSAMQAAAEPSADPDCRLAAATGDLAALLRESGELVMVGGTVELLHSTDLGVSWRREEMELDCAWPDLAEVNGRLLISCSSRKAPGRLLVLAEIPDGGWTAPVEVDADADRFIDTHLQALPDGELILFATQIDRHDDLDDAVYTVRMYRSRDGGVVWSAGETVVKGRRGRHLEDTRSVLLEGGSVLLAYESEKAEGAPSKVRQLRSTDGGRSWSRDGVIWAGADVEPGGYVLFGDGELWFVASSDERAGGGSYDRASILMRRSMNGGRSWTEPEVLVETEDQLSFGGVVLPGDDVILPSLRHYTGRKPRGLSLYVVGRDPSEGSRCASPPISTEGFENGLDSQWQ